MSPRAVAAFADWHVDPAPDCLSDSAPELASSGSPSDGWGAFAGQGGRRGRLRRVPVREVPVRSWRGSESGGELGTQPREKLPARIAAGETRATPEFGKGEGGVAHHAAPVSEPVGIFGPADNVEPAEVAKTRGAATAGYGIRAGQRSQFDQRSICTGTGSGSAGGAFYCDINAAIDVTIWRGIGVWQRSQFDQRFRSARARVRALRTGLCIVT